MFNKNYLIFLFLFLLIVIPSVSAIPPVLSTVQVGSLEIIAPTWEYPKQNTAMDFYWHVLNTSQYFTNTSATCFFHLYSKENSGEHIYVVDPVTKFGNSRDFEVSVNATNFSSAGAYCSLIECNTSIQAGALERCFLVTESGVELTEGRSLLSLGLLAILVLFMFISLFYLYQVEDYRGKFVLYWVSHVLFMLITFAGWQMGVEGLLGGMALTGIFRIMFWITAVASFPLIIGSLAWIFYTHTMGDDVRNMVDKGMGVEEAFSRSAKKRYF